MCQNTSKWHAELGLFLSPEDGGDMLPQVVDVSPEVHRFKSIRQYSFQSPLAEPQTQQTMKNGHIS
jgi:hypothetical protein